MILAHLRSGQEPESDRVWRVRVKGSGWGSQRGCHSTTGGTPKRSCGCSAWAEEAFAWTASSRCSADGCIISGKSQDVSADGFHTDLRRKASNDQNSSATISVPVLSILPLTLLASPGHLGFAADFPGRTNLDRSVLQCSSLQSHPVATLINKNIIILIEGNTKHLVCLVGNLHTFSNSSTTSVWTSPWTDSPLM